MVLFSKRKADNTSYSKPEENTQDVTYYTCLKVLSESIAKLPIHLKDRDGNKIYRHSALKCLSDRPNAYMTPTNLKQVLEINRNHFGNAYLFIEYDYNHSVKGLYPLYPPGVNIYIDNENILKNSRLIYEYTIPNTEKVMYIPANQIIHLKGGLVEDGIIGKSVREELKEVFAIKDSQNNCLSELYDNGLTANGVINYTGDLNTAKRKRLIEELSSLTSSGSERFIPLPFGMELKPIDLKFTDAQFYELKKYSDLQIASTFGIKPNHLNDYSKSSYSNSEMQNLTFYVDTLLFILTQYEEEFNNKLLTESERLDKGYHFQFNVSSILRGDIKTQSESVSRLVQSGVYTVNEARKYLGMPDTNNGDTIMVNGAYVRLEEIGKAYQKNDLKGGE